MESLLSTIYGKQSFDSRRLAGTFAAERIRRRSTGLGMASSEQGVWMQPTREGQGGSSRAEPKGAACRNNVDRRDCGSPMAGKQHALLSMRRKN